MQSRTLGVGLIVQASCVRGSFVIAAVLPVFSGPLRIWPVTEQECVQCETAAVSGSQRLTLMERS